MILRDSTTPFTHLPDPLGDSQTIKARFGWKRFGSCVVVFLGCLWGNLLSLPSILQARSFATSQDETIEKLNKKISGEKDE